MRTRKLPYLILSTLLALAAYSAVRSSEPEPTAAHPGLFLPQPVHGGDAIRTLGPGLDRIAALNQIAPAELRADLQRDPDLWVDQGGRLVFTCQPPSAQALSRQARFPQPTGAPPYDPTLTFKLHSRPQSSKKIYLDFLGYNTPAGGPWNNGNAIDSVPWDLDGNPTTTGPVEHEAYQRVWQRVAEDYAPMDVDVTTEDPGVEGLRKSGPGDPAYGIRVVISPTSAWFPGVGGIAYLTSFNWDTDTPCFVFPDRLGPDVEKYVADAAAHEAGHTVGLSHDGQNGGIGYYAGAGGWGPIMGAPYGQAITTWNPGDYVNANNQEDDFLVMTKYGPKVVPDEAGDTIAAAAPVPSGTTPTVSGIISSRTDVDVYQFETGNGPVTIAAAPWVFGPNMDIQLDLLDGSGAVLATANQPGFTPAALGASINTSLTAGTYYVRVDGVAQGDPLKGTGYTDYGSVGNYTLTFSLQVSQPPKAPTNLTAAAVSSSEIDLSWTDNAANEGGFEIERALGSGPFSKIGTVTNNRTSYHDTAVVSGSTFTYRVRAFNAAGTSAYTNEASATPPYDRPGAPTLTTVAVTSSTSADVTWSTGAGVVDTYEVQRKENGGAFRTIATFPADTTSFSDTGLTAGATEAYRVRSQGPGGTSDWSNELGVTLPPGAPTGLSATLSGTAVRLAWSHSGGARFRLERQLDGAAFIKVGEFASTTTSVTDNGVPTNSTASYRVQAVTAAGVSDYSNVATISMSPGLLAFNFKQSSVKAKGQVTGTVQLANPAGAGGAVVALSSDSGAIALPASVTVPAGQTGATFTCKTTAVSKTVSLQARATLGGNTRLAYLTVKK